VRSAPFPAGNEGDTHCFLWPSMSDVTDGNRVGRFLQSLEQPPPKQKTSRGVRVRERVPLRHGATLCVSSGSIIDFGGGTEWPPLYIAVVNAANRGGLRGGGVDGAFVAAGGASLATDRRNLPIVRGTRSDRIETGGARPTGPNRYGRLHASTVIHAVGPNYLVEHNQGVSMKDCDKLLSRAYRSSLAVARDCGVQFLGFSLLSAGIFRGGRSLDDVLRIAVDAVAEGAYEGLREVHLVAFLPDELQALTKCALEMRKRDEKDDVRAVEDQADSGANESTCGDATTAVSGDSFEAFGAGTEGRSVTSPSGSPREVFSTCVAGDSPWGAGNMCGSDVLDTPVGDFRQAATTSSLPFGHASAGPTVVHGGQAPSVADHLTTAPRSRGNATSVDRPVTVGRASSARRGTSIPARMCGSARVRGDASVSGAPDPAPSHVDQVSGRTSPSSRQRSGSAPRFHGTCGSTRAQVSGYPTVMPGALLPPPPTAKPGQTAPTPTPTTVSRGFVSATAARANARGGAALTSAKDMLPSNTGSCRASANRPSGTATGPPSSLRSRSNRAPLSRCAARGMR